MLIGFFILISCSFLNWTWVPFFVVIHECSGLGSWKLCEWDNCLTRLEMYYMPIYESFNCSSYRNLPLCILPDFPSVFSLALLPFSFCCYRTTTATLCHWFVSSALRAYVCVHLMRFLLSLALLFIIKLRLPEWKAISSIQGTRQSIRKPDC